MSAPAMNTLNLPDILGAQVSPELVANTRFGLGAVAAFSEITERPHLIARSMDMVVVTNDFLDGKVTSAISTAAALHPVRALVSNPRHQDQLLRTINAAKMALDDGTGTYHYGVGVMSDGPEMEKWVSNHRHDPNVHKNARIVEALTTDGDRDLPKWVWKRTKSGMADPHDMVELLRIKNGVGVNLETTALNAISLYLDLRGTKDTGEQLLQKIVMADAVYAPFAEVTTLDGLGMLVRSEGARRLFEKVGETAKFDRANEILSPYVEDRDMIKQVTETLIRRLTGGDCIVDVAFKDNSNHGIVFLEGGLGNVPIFEDPNQDIAQISARIKSPGSLAKKMFWPMITGSSAIKEPEIPLDILAVTIVVENQQEVARLYSELVKRLMHESTRENPTIQSAVPPSRARLQTPFHIAGDELFLRRMFTTLEQTQALPGIDARMLVDYRETLNGFTVAKGTSTIMVGQQLFRTEIQILDKESRRANRLGRAAHIVHKSGKPVDPADLEEIYSRVAAMRDMSLTEPSEKRAAHLERQIRNHKPGPLERSTIDRLIA